MGADCLHHHHHHNTRDDDAAALTTPVNATNSGPQCCHCGWRGDHEPACPFRPPVTK
ncbi:hypothetical protein BDZ89DRAFT_1067438 [Hymenopellis radicata]|nr:hypothetical protein BDZ89DRAFT_1067438 [Hymenopellis radicata]